METESEDTRLLLCLPLEGLERFCDAKSFSTDITHIGALLGVNFRFKRSAEGDKLARNLNSEVRGDSRIAALLGSLFLFLVSAQDRQVSGADIVTLDNTLLNNIGDVLVPASAAASRATDTRKNTTLLSLGIPLWDFPALLAGIPNPWTHLFGDRGAIVF